MNQFPLCYNFVQWKLTGRYHILVYLSDWLVIPSLPSQNSTWCIQVLRSPKEAFAAAMQSWHERCKKCVCLQGDYVEK